MRAALVLLMAAWFALPASAETVYIHDILRVGIRTQANSSESPITVVTSGTELSVLERDGGYMRVRTPSGVEGWINSDYTTNELPARMRLERVEKERDALKADLAKARATQNAESSQAEQLSARIDSLQQDNQRLQQSVTELTTDLQQKEGGNTWVYIALAMILLFALGIYLGVRWAQQRVAQRFGGLEL